MIQMALTKDDARVLFDEGVLSADSGMHKDAIKNFDKVMEIDLNAEVLFNKGISLAALERNDEALECYDKAIQLDSNDEFVLYNKGVLLLSLIHI